MEAAQILGTRGYIMGGYARDVQFGKIPKDMDIFAPIPDNGLGPDGQMNPEGLLQRAATIMALFGQIPDAAEFRGRQGRYGDGQDFVAVKSLPQDNPQWQPIDVVFNRQFTGTNPEEFITRHFDLDICKVYIDRTRGIRFTNNAAALGAFARNYEIFDQFKAMRYDVTSFAKRVKHLSEKYPGFSAMAKVPFATLPRVVQAMVDQGVLNAAREIFQEQTEAPLRDEVRLNDRGEVPQAVRDHFGQLVRNGGIRQWAVWDDPTPFDNLQGVQGGVQGGAPV